MVGEETVTGPVIIAANDDEEVGGFITSITLRMYSVNGLDSNTIQCRVSYQYFESSSSAQVVLLEEEATLTVLGEY